MSTVIAVVVTYKSTQKILNRIAKTSEEHTCILNKLVKASDEHTQILKDNKEILKTLAQVAQTTEQTLKEVVCNTAKTAHGLRANARMHGWAYAENVASEEEARKLGEPYDYDLKLKTCYYKVRET